MQYYSHSNSCRSQWPRGLRRRSAAAPLLRLWVRIPSGAWMSVCCDCCVLSGRGLCDGLITRPEESYRLWCVVVCDLEKPRGRGGHSPRLGCKRHKKNGACLIINKKYIHTYTRRHARAHTHTQSQFFLHIDQVKPRYTNKAPLSVHSSWSYWTYCR